MAKTQYLKTPKGRLTVYGFGCGYIETKSTDFAAYRSGDLYTELYHEGACYHVRQFDRRKGAKVFRVFWESFPNLTEAKKLFDKQPGKIK